MTLEEIKKEIPKMSQAERREVVTLLASIELDQDKSYWERIRRRTKGSDARAIENS